MPKLRTILWIAAAYVTLTLGAMAVLAWIAAPSTWPVPLL